MALAAVAIESGQGWYANRHLRGPALSRFAIGKSDPSDDVSGEEDENKYGHHAISFVAKHRTVPVLALGCRG